MPNSPKPEDLTSLKVDMAKLEGKLENAVTKYEQGSKETINKIDGLVTKIEFAPIKALVYGMVAIMCSSVIGALLAKVIIK
jgi:hypothetical protein